MKTCLYRPITLNIIAYQIFPQLYDIQPSLDSYIEQAHFNGILLIDNLTDNTKTTYQYVSMIDFTSYAGKHIRISNSNQLGNVFVGEWNIEGTPLPETEMPESIKEHMVLWYDIARQGATNESMAANSILKDLSGNGHNGECIGFDWTSDSGINEGAIISDGVDDWVHVPDLPRLTPENGFTVIAQRQRLGDSSIYAAFASKATDATETDGAFIIERFDSNGDVNNVRVRSFGAVTNIVEAADDIMWCTSHQYQGANLTVGDDEDSTELALFKFSCNPTEQYCGKYALYKFLMFDKDLSDKEIIWVLTQLMGIDLNFMARTGTGLFKVNGDAQTTKKGIYRSVKCTKYSLSAWYYFSGDSYSSLIGDYGWVSITEQVPSGTQIFITADYQQNITGETRSIDIPYTINYINPDISDVENLPITEKVFSTYVTIEQESLPLDPTFKTATEAVAGDAVLYDQTNDHLVIVSSDDIAKCATGYTPVGVVVVPGNHDVYGDGSCGVMSLKKMACKNKEGGVLVNNMKWGDYDIDPSILPYMSAVPIGNTSNGIPIDASAYGYLPSLQVSDYPCLHDTNVYYSVSELKQSPSPYLTDGSRNPGYYQITTPLSDKNCLADFDGRNNTNKIITARGNRDYTSWSPTAYNESDYPAASCCDMFYTDGTQQGDWYLPACGELGYMIPVFNNISESITSILNTYGASVGGVLDKTRYWSSSKSHSRYARSIKASDCEIVYGGFSDPDSSNARAFLKVNDSMLQPKPKFIDLGLPSGNLWCDRNLGASSPEDVGLYFQWGDAQGYTPDQIGNEEGQKSFSQADCKWAIELPDGYGYTKYFSGDDKKILDPEDDAAYTMLGDEYRMPTLDDIVELCQNTDIYLVPTEGEEIRGNIVEGNIYVLRFEWENNSSDIKGIKFYKKNDKETYLFVPTSGVAGSGSVYSAESIGNLWTSTRNPSNVGSAGNLYFNSDNGYIFYTVRHNGMNIRAIKPGEQTITNAVLTENNEAVLLEDNNPIITES